MANLGFGHPGWRGHGVGRGAVVGHFEFGQRIGVARAGGASRNGFLAAATGPETVAGRNGKALAQLLV